MQSRFNDLNLTFDWDSGNKTKNWKKHKVSIVEAEQVFFNAPIVVQRDIKHSSAEERLFALGKTNSGKYLFLAFTIRGLKIRVISARPMDRRERKYYTAIKLH